MTLAKKMMSYFFALTAVTAFGVWFCNGVAFLPIHDYLFQFKVFTVFIGTKEFVTNLLLGISTSALFAAFGFWVDYADKKRTRQDELVTFYTNIHRKCLERIFYEKNSYENDYTEVQAMFDYLCSYKSIVFDYSLLFLRIKTKILRILDRVIRRHKHDDISIKYIKEDKYALICKIFSTLYHYFLILDCYQGMVCNCQRALDILSEKKKQVATDSTDYTMYSTYISSFQDELKSLRRKILGNYLYGAEALEPFDKKELLALVHAADLNFPGEIVRHYDGFLHSVVPTYVRDDI